MYLRKTVVTALKIKNWLLGVLSVITVLVCGFYIVSEFVDYRDTPEYAWEAVDMKFSIVMVCVGLAVLLAVIISARCIGNAAFYSSYFEGDLDGEVSFADLAKVVGKSEGTVRRQLSFYSAVYMTGFGFSQDGRGVQLNSKTCLCECRSCGAHIEKKIYFTGECPYCHSSDLHAKVLSGEHFYSISNEAQSGTGNADFYRSGAFNAKSVLIFVLVVLGTLVVSVMAIFTIMQISYYFDEEYQKQILLDPSRHLSSYELIKKEILDLIVFALTILVVLTPVVVIRWRKLLALFSARYWSIYFATVNTPFICEDQLPQYTVGRSGLARMRRAIRCGYLKNCTLEVHDGVLMVALAKKTVKDRCLSCGAPLVGVADENSRCSYCGNLIMGVLEKR